MVWKLFDPGRGQKGRCRPSLLPPLYLVRGESQPCSASGAAAARGALEWKVVGCAVHIPSAPASVRACDVHSSAPADSPVGEPSGMLGEEAPHELLPFSRVPWTVYPSIAALRAPGRLAPFPCQKVGICAAHE